MLWMEIYFHNCSLSAQLHMRHVAWQCMHMYARIVVTGNIGTDTLVVTTFFHFSFLIHM